MGTTSVDIYCLHRDNTDIPVGDFIDMLNELKNEGLIGVLEHQIGHYIDSRRLMNMLLQMTKSHSQF